MNKTKLIALILGIAALGVSCWNLFSMSSEYKRSTDTYSQLESMVATKPAQETTAPTEAAAPEAAPEETTAEETAPTAPSVGFPEVDFPALLEINEDTVGWLTLDGTVLNYPIAQGKDNAYYLDHMFTRDGNGSGCICMDAHNSPDFSDRNTILYGHNMKNGTMFAPLLDYKKQDFYEAHPRLLLMTPDGNYTVDLFTAYVVSSHGDAWKMDFESDAEYEAWLLAAKAESTFQSPVVPTAQDRVLSLSTCTYEFDDARYVIVGVLNKVD